MSTLSIASAGALKPHPACLILPDMPEADYQKLKEDISGLGVRHPIVLYQGMILDGRHRYRACLELGIDPPCEDWQGGMSVVDFVLSENLHRRHLDASQRAMVAANAMAYHTAAAKERQEAAGAAGGGVTIKQRLEKEISSGGENKVSAPGALTLPEGAALNVARKPLISENSTAVGAPSPKAPDSGKSAAAAAREVGVSPRTVEQAVYVRTYGTLDDAAAVLAGESSVKAKAEEVKARQALLSPPSPSKPQANPVEGYVTPADWLAMDAGQRQAVLSQPTDKKLNVQDNTSIDWAAYSWNPLTGCDHGCAYCYARDIATRFYGDLGFAPALHPSRLLIPFNHKSPGTHNNRVFTCSMADLFGAWVPREWIAAVLDVCGENPAFEFLLLTKNPKRLTEFAFPSNCWVGATTDTQQRMKAAERIFADVDASVKWVSVEPMMEPILPQDPATFDWYVIGGASASSAQAGFTPPFEWVARLALAALDAKREVFIKTNFWGAGRPKGFPTRRGLSGLARQAFYTAHNREAEQ